MDSLLISLNIIGIPEIYLSAQNGAVNVGRGHSILERRDIHITAYDELGVADSNEEDKSIAMKWRKATISPVHRADIDAPLKPLSEYYDANGSILPQWLETNVTRLPDSKSEGKMWIDHPQHGLMEVYKYDYFYGLPTTENPGLTLMGVGLQRFFEQNYKGPDGKGISVLRQNAVTGRFEFFQPVLFNYTTSTDDLFKLTVQMTDFAGDVNNLEFSTDGETWQSESTLSYPTRENNVVFVRDSTGTIGKRDIPASDWVDNILP